MALADAVDIATAAEQAQMAPLLHSKPVEAALPAH